MSCWGCTEFTKGHTGSYQRGCDECDARAMANSQIYFDAKTDKAMCFRYREFMKSRYGERWEAMHERVKHWAGAIAALRGK